MRQGSSQGVLDVIVGMTVSNRSLNQVAVKKFGKGVIPKNLTDDGPRTLPAWFWGFHLTDEALDVTQKRLADSEFVITGDAAILKIKWQEGDGPHNAFWFAD